jgi:mono/diheme cytochrome c family protein
MKRVVGGLVILAAAMLAAAQAAVPGTPDGRAERGRYLVERVAQCPECHTPRDGSGNLIRTQFLQGAPVPVKAPPYPNMRWAFQAPAIAGLAGFTDPDVTRLLTEGIVVRTGQPPTPPMPRFRFSREDAEAVIAFLRSLR